MMWAKKILFVVFLVAFGVAVHDFAHALYEVGGYGEILSLQGGWFGFAFMLICFLLYTTLAEDVKTKTTTRKIGETVGKGSLLTLGIALITVATEVIKESLEYGAITAAIGLLCVFAFILLLELQITRRIQK